MLLQLPSPASVLRVEFLIITSKSETKSQSFIIFRMQNKDPSLLTPTDLLQSFGGLSSCQPSSIIDISKHHRRQSNQQTTSSLDLKQHSALSSRNCERQKKKKRWVGETVLVFENHRHTA